MDNKNLRSHRGPQLRLVKDNEREESESASTSFEDIIAEIQGKAKPLNAAPQPKSKLASQMTKFADDLDKQIAELLAL